MSLKIIQIILVFMDIVLSMPIELKRNRENKTLKEWLEEQYFKFITYRELL